MTEDVCHMRKEAALGLTVIFIFAVSMSATVYADASYSIFIMDPTNSSNGGKGISSSGYWVGQIPIQITSGTTTSQAQAYCMQAERIIYIGSTYTATLTPTPDSANWKAISYILSWYNPTDSTTAAVNQVAIWKLLNPSYQRESWLDQTIYNSWSPQHLFQPPE